MLGFHMTNSAKAIKSTATRRAGGFYLTLSPESAHTVTTCTSVLLRMVDMDLAKQRLLARVPSERSSILRHE